MRSRDLFTRGRGWAGIITPFGDVGIVPAIVPGGCGTIDPLVSVVVPGSANAVVLSVFVAVIGGALIGELASTKTRGGSGPTGYRMTITETLSEPFRSLVYAAPVVRYFVR